MSRYARPVALDGKHRMYDVTDTADYNPKPEWWTSDAAALDKMFAPNKAAWEQSGQWFVQVPQGVKDCAVHTGSDYMDAASYVNPDNTDGNGNPL